MIWTEFVDVRDFGRNSQLDTSRRQHDRRKIERHAIGLLRESELATPALMPVPQELAGGDRDGAAGHEFCALPRDRRDGGLGKRVGDALSLEGLEGGAQVLAPLEPIQSRLGGGDSAVDGERIVEAEASVWPAAAQIDAELLDDFAMNFRDRDVQANLVGAADRQGVDHPSTSATGRFAAGPARSAAAGAPPEAFEMEIEAPGAPVAGVSLTKPSAISSAFWASSADATDPVRMIVFSTVRT